VIAAMTFPLVACVADRAVAPGTTPVWSAIPGGAIPIEQFDVLRLPTYDGGGETVHPTYIGPTSRWPTSTHYLFVTPYPRGATAVENPSVFAGVDGATWDTLPQAPNPLVHPSAHGYLSDPEAVYEPDRNEIYLYYREVTDSNIIRMISSRDAVRWSQPIVVVAGPGQTVVSPAVVRKGPGNWLMWTVNAGRQGGAATTTKIDLRRSTDGVNWSAPQNVSLTQPGTWPWHLDVKWIPSRFQYWAIYDGKRPGDCATDVLYMATSPDGVTWTTYPTPVLTAGATPALEDIVYRSTFAFDAADDVITFWYSGARYDGAGYTWSTVMQRRPRGEVFAQIAEPHAGATTARRRIPPLLNPP